MVHQVDVNASGPVIRRGAVPGRTGTRHRALALRLGDGHVRGVDVIRVRDGQIAESLAYVKG
jgi:hypothetical protein